MHIMAQVELSAQELARTVRLDMRRRRLPLLLLCAVAAGLAVAWPLSFWLRWGRRSPGRVLVWNMLTSPVFWLLLLFFFVVLLLLLRTGARPAHPAAHLYGCISWDISAEGIAGYRDGRRSVCLAWPAVTALLQHDELMVLLHKTQILAVFPRRCFAPEQWPLATQLTHDAANEAISGHWNAPLAPAREACLWRFCFLLDRHTLEQAAAVRPAPPAGEAGGMWLPILLACACLGGTLWLGLCTGNAALVAVGAVCCLVASLWALARGFRRRQRRPVLPGYWQGYSLLEVGQEGIRFCSEQFEAYYPYTRLTAAVGAPGIVLVFAGGAPVAALPCDNQTFAEASEALDYIYANIK